MNQFRAATAAFGFTALVAGWALRLDAQVAPGIASPRAEVAPRRAELERRFRQRSAEIVRRQLQLSDDQMSRLQTANQQFDGQRMALVGEERRTRQALRAELEAGAGANQSRVSGLLDQLMRLQRQRLDLVASEQRELGRFMTPVQRAKYFGLQNQLRKRMLELSDRAGPAVRQGMMRPRQPGGRRILRLR